MPLVARYKDQRVEAWLVERDAWLALKMSYRDTGVTMVCGEPGFPKTSENGLQFFAHKSAGCAKHEGGAESPEHLQTKELIAAAASRHGFEAIVESPAYDRSFIIDVLLIKGNRRIAVEAQWANQSDADFVSRTARYKSAGLEVLWLVGPRNKAAIRDVRAELLSGAVDNIAISIPLELGKLATTLPLSDGLDLLFSGSLKSKIEPVVTGASIETAMAKCWNEKCGKWISLWYLRELDIETRCGQLATVTLHAYENWLPERVEEGLQQNAIAQLSASGLPEPTYYERRYSKIAQRYYIAQNCPHCRVVQGDGFVAQDRRWTPYWVSMRERVALPKSVYEERHRCISVGRGTCDPALNMAPLGEQRRGKAYLSSVEDRSRDRRLPLKGERNVNR